MSQESGDFRQCLQGVLSRIMPGADIWAPDTGAEADRGQILIDGPVHLLLLADDGNQLVAVAWVEEGGPGGDQDPRDALRRVGLRVGQAALDAGIHRGLVLVVGRRTMEDASSAPAPIGAALSRGQFRALDVPWPAGGQAEASLERTLASLGPLPSTSFLEAVPEERLADVLDEPGVLPEGLGELASPLREDIALFLRDGAWPVGRSWPSVAAALDLRVASLSHGSAVDGTDGVER